MQSLSRQGRPEPVGSKMAAPANTCHAGAKPGIAPLSRSRVRQRRWRHAVCRRGALATVAASLIALALAPLASASSVATWGYNRQGQLGDGHSVSEQLYSDAPVAVKGITEAIAVSGTRDSDLALLSNGTVEQWGSIPGHSVASSSDEPGLIGGLTNVKEVAAGDGGFALLKSGTIDALSSGTPTPVPGITTARSIVAGESDAMAVLSNNTVVAWGDDETGQLGNGKIGSFGEEFPTPTPVLCSSQGPCNGEGHLGEVEAVSIEDAVFGGHALALLKSGEVEYWGGSTGVEPSSLPTKVSGITGARAVVAGRESSLALLSSETVDGWGLNYCDELGDGKSYAEEEQRQTPEAVVGLSGVKTISAVSANSGDERQEACTTYLATENGRLYSWGTNGYGALGQGLISGPELLGFPGDGSVRSVSDRPAEVTGFTGEPRGVKGAVALATANPATFLTFTNWMLAGTLGFKGFEGETASFSGGSFSGTGALHGQASGELTAAFLAPLRWAGVVPMKLGLRLVPEAPEGTTARDSVRITSLSMLGLTIPTNCRTTKPVSFALATPESISQTRVAASGSFSLPAFKCEGGFLGAPFGRFVLTPLLSHPGNSYSFAMEP